MVVVPKDFLDLIKERVLFLEKLNSLISHRISEKNRYQYLYFSKKENKKESIFYHVIVFGVEHTFVAISGRTGMEYKYYTG